MKRLIATIVIFAVFIVCIAILDRRDQRRKARSNENGGSDASAAHAQDAEDDPVARAIKNLQTEYITQSSHQTREQKAVRNLSVLTLMFVGAYTFLSYCSLQITRQSFTDVQRAFVFMQTITQGPRNIQSQGRIVWEFFPVWENSGTTPADDVRIYAKVDPMDAPLTKDYKFGWSDSAPFLLAPKGTINSVSDWVPIEDVTQKLRFSLGGFPLLSGLLSRQEPEVFEP